MRRNLQCKRFQIMHVDSTGLKFLFISWKESGFFFSLCYGNEIRTLSLVIFQSVIVYCTYNGSSWMMWGNKQTVVQVPKDNYDLS